MPTESDFTTPAVYFDQSDWSSSDSLTNTAAAYLANQRAPVRSRIETLLSYQKDVTIDGTDPATGTLLADVSPGTDYSICVHKILFIGPSTIPPLVGARYRAGWDGDTDGNWYPNQLQITAASMDTATDKMHVMRKDGTSHNDREVFEAMRPYEDGYPYTVREFKIWRSTFQDTAITWKWVLLIGSLHKLGNEALP